VIAMPISRFLFSNRNLKRKATFMHVTARPLFALLGPLLALTAVTPFSAQAVQATAQLSNSSLSDGYGSQNSQAIHLEWAGGAAAANRVTHVLLEHKQAFGERAGILAVNHGWDLGERDRVNLALSASDAPTIAARWRLDAQYSRKLGAAQNIVASVGGFISSTADGHRDRSLILSTAWYAAAGHVLEGGLRIARSDPGGQTASRIFGVYTWGLVGHDTVTLRAEGGREAYQSLGEAKVAVANFASQELGLNWRHWLTPEAGLGLDAATYASPAYRKNTLGVNAFFNF
jgi:YaiO family outer membrane protein